MIKNFKKTKSSGYALLEMVFYISLFAVVSIVVINSMIVMMKSFKETRINSELTQSGTIMEKISREIRQADSIYSVSASLLGLNVKDENGQNRRVEISLVGSDVKFSENDVLVGNLNTPNISIMGLNFTQIVTTKGTAVKILLTVKSNHDSQNRTENFYDTVVLRGDY